MEEAIRVCPMNPALYYLAARLELSRKESAGAGAGLSTCVSESCGTSCKGRSYHVDMAVDWLSRCVRAFYRTDSAEVMSTTCVLTLYRYRMLGGRMLGDRVVGGSYVFWRVFYL